MKPSDRKNSNHHFDFSWCLIEAHHVTSPTPPPPSRLKQSPLRFQKNGPFGLRVLTIQFSLIRRTFLDESPLIVPIYLPEQLVLLPDNSD